jgi:hypothetical protein
MRKLLLAAAAGAALMATASVANATLLYQLDVTATYSDAAPEGAVGYTGQPDTSWLIFTNSGPTTFVGDLGDVAMSQFSGDFSLSYAVTLAPGQSFSFGTSPESSNVGGFNGPFGGVQPGIVATIVGNFGATAVNLSVADANMHSGVFRTNPFGVTLDNYVLQGGDNIGRDTGDGYEETQADSHFRFSAEGRGVPEPATWAMMLLGFGGLGSVLRRRKAVIA